jgi:hypothetical protein
MTNEQLAAIREWLQQASEPCGNDACIGEWAAVHGRALLDEVERLRDLLRRCVPDELAVYAWEEA